MKTKFKIQKMNSSGDWIFVAGSSDKISAYKIAGAEWGLVRVIEAKTGKEV